MDAALRQPNQTGRAQKNRFENRSGESSKTSKNKRVNGENDLPVISQDGVSLSPTLHQTMLIQLKHVTKVPMRLIATKQMPELFFGIFQSRFPPRKQPN